MKQALQTLQKLKIKTRIPNKEVMMDTIDVKDLPDETAELLQKFVDFLKQQAKFQEDTEEKQWQELSKYGSNIAEKQKLTEKDINRIVEEYRNE